MNDQREPTADELAAMAYVDGELEPDERRAFELRVERDPELAREVAAHQRLNVLARHAVGAEPMDAQWARIARSPAQRGLRFVAWLLVLAGALGLCAWAVFEVETADIGLVPKLSVAALVLGFALFVALALRARAATAPYDPYTDVKR